MADYKQFKIILDVPAVQPAFGFDRSAAAFANIVLTSAPHFAIGIFGQWGSGKTTLLSLIANRLPADRVIVVPFSAWRYEKEEHLIVPLLDTIREALLHWGQLQGSGIRRTATKVATTVGKATRALASGFQAEVSVGAGRISFDANKALTTAEKLSQEEAAAQVPRSHYKASFDALRDAFSTILKSNRRFAIFIDDLDRCLPHGALEVLESMKLFFDLDGFVFIVALDRKIVEQCVEAKYAREFPTSMQDPSHLSVRGEDYIKKIFQVPFDIEPVSPSEIKPYVASICREGALPANQCRDLIDRVLPHLEFVARETRINPREIKRYLNSYTISMKVKPNLDPDAVLALRAFDFRPDWNDALQGFLTDRELFIDALQQPDPRAALLELDESFAGIPESFFAYLRGPGAALKLIADNIPDYIYSGEGFSSKAGSLYADMVRYSSRFRREIHAADHTRAVLEAKQHLERLRSLVGPEASRISMKPITEQIKKISFILSSTPHQIAKDDEELGGIFSTWKSSLYAEAQILSRLTKDLAQPGP
ncbi:MAG TPA: P-loop NTPase fold protein [Thermoanaerobaculia bacterium]|nr:P-loop NTPase fold protein [Thermoanaerobaculia bacterium]